MLIFVNKHQCQIWLANNELARNSVMLGMFGSLGFSCIACSWARTFEWNKNSVGGPWL